MGLGGVAVELGHIRHRAPGQRFRGVWHESCWIETVETQRRHPLLQRHRHHFASQAMEHREVGFGGQVV